jgi:hypothetical protein
MRRRRAMAVGMDVPMVVAVGMIVVIVKVGTAHLTMLYYNITGVYKRNPDSPSEGGERHDERRE